MKTTLAWLAASCLLACDSYDDVKIQQTAPPSGRVGEAYAHTFSVTRAVEDAWFIDCRHSDLQQSLKMEMTREGKLSFEPPNPGSLQLCVEYRRRDGDLDVWKPTIEISPRAGESAEELRAEVEKIRKKLAKVHAAVGAAAQPKASDCPSNLAGTAHAYDAALLAAAVAGPGTKAEGPNVSLHPAGYDLLRFTDAELKGTSHESVKQLGSTSHIVVTRPTTMQLPELKPGEKFVMGTYQGFAFVVAAETAEILCTRPLAYASSDKVEWTELVEVAPDGTKKGEPVRDFDEVFKDFDLQGHVALKKAIGEQAPKLELRL
jgi:hypothetical protein